MLTVFPTPKPLRPPLHMSVNIRHVASALLFTTSAAWAVDALAGATLLGRAVLPASALAPSPSAGQFVQGFSAVLRGPKRGTYYVMGDNVFGAKANSADALLRVYAVEPDFHSGTVHPVDFVRGKRLPGFSPESFITLRDPDRTLGFAVVADGATYPGSTLKLPRSRGFEGMALSANPQFLYTLLEGALTSDSEPRRLIINQFDLQKRAYTERSWAYKRDDVSHAIGNFTAVSRHLLLVIERDGGQGPTAKFKKIFKVDLRRSDAEGFLHKEEVVDLLAIADPEHRGGHGTVNGVFSFPFVTIEDVLPLGERKLLVINDNNYRFSNGRAAGVPDDNEFILIRLARPLATGEDEDEED